MIVKSMCKVRKFIIPSLQRVPSKNDRYGDREKALRLRERTTRVSSLVYPLFVWNDCVGTHLKHWKEQSKSTTLFSIISRSHVFIFLYFYYIYIRVEGFICGNLLLWFFSSGRQNGPAVRLCGLLKVTIIRSGIRNSEFA